MNEPNKCLVCVHHEAVGIKYRYKYEESLKVLDTIKSTLAEAIFLEVTLDPVKLATFIEKRLTQLSE